MSEFWGIFIAMSATALTALFLVLCATFCVNYSERRNRRLRDPTTHGDEGGYPAHLKVDETTWKGGGI